MKRLCDLLRRSPGLFWIIAAAGVFLCAAGTPRLPGGETWERIINAVKLASLLLGVFCLRKVIRGHDKVELYTLIGTLSLTLTVTVTLAAWFFRV